MKKVLFLYLLTLLLSLTIGAIAQVHKPITAGAEYPYWEWKPDSAKHMIIFIHGHGERGNGTFNFTNNTGELNRVLGIGIPKLINTKLKDGTRAWKRKEFIVISPQYAVDKNYLYPPTLKKFIARMAAKYGIAPENISLVGISGGGISVWNYIVMFNDIKKAIPIAGTAPYKEATQASATQIWAVHGDLDPTCKIITVTSFMANYNALAGVVPMRLDVIINYKHEPGVWDRACEQSKYFDWLLGK
jgi:predicted peptidase